MMHAPVTHILALTRLRRARMLEQRGSVLVRVGQELNALDVVAEAPPRRKHLLLDVPEMLGIPKSRFSKSVIGREVGDKLTEGDVIAEAGGMFKRVVRAPADSEILMIMSGVMLLQVDQPVVPLLAGLSGTVVDVLPERGAIIESTGALLQGVWGNGRISAGTLVMLAQGPAGELKADRLDISLRGSVGVAGQCRDRAALLAAAELPLQGLVLGSMPSDLIATALQIEIPLILLEGFGNLPIHHHAYKILSTNEKRDIDLNAAPLDRYLGERPELLIPLPATAEFPPETDQFRFGQTVKVLSAPHQSMTGTLEEIHYEPVLLPNGLRTKVATIRLENNERVSIPFTNLEVLE